MTVKSDDQPERAVSFDAIGRNEETAGTEWIIEKSLDKLTCGGKCRLTGGAKLPTLHP
jgi:hypothetical protein